MNWLIVWIVGFLSVYMVLGTKAMAVILLSAIMFATVMVSAFGTLGIWPGALLGILFGLYVGMRRNLVA